MTLFVRMSEHERNRCLGIRTNKRGREWRYTHELCVVARIAEAGDDRWFEATVMDVSIG